MRFSLAWLREWVDWSVPVEALEERLTLAGLEIEERLRVGPDLSAVRVGRVEHCERHPDADRLSLCRVDVGMGEPVAIVCGAPNVAAGQKVAVALPGSELPGGLRIKRAKIRGVASEGMICSARELGLPGEESGILVLDPSAPTGTALPEVLPVGDVVLDVEITPNRGDWVSMLGMAREVRAHFGGPLRLPPTEPAEDGPPAAAAVRVEIDDPAGCRRYAARVVRGLSPGKSPEWLSQRLEAAGLRSIDLIVDVTNLVMLEFGQPLHAFDLARLRGGVVRVRGAQAGERITTLDGQERELAEGDLVIADAEGAVAIAGVMGGSGSEVGEGTTDVLIESAHFDPVRIRRTARRLGLHSDASYRFERGVDPGGVARAADRAARLLQELAGGKVARGVVEAVGEALPPPPEIRLSPERVNRLLGTQLSGPESAALLERLDVSVRAEGGMLLCRPPGWRADLRQPEDLVEEVARVHGYDRLPETLPHGALAGVETPPGRSLGHAVRDALAAAGLVEIVTFPGAREEDADALRWAPEDPRRRAVAIANPIQAGQACLRTHLAPSLLRAALHNLSHQVDDVAIFEVGRTFHARAEGELPEERLQAALLLTEERSGGPWRGPAVPVFFRAKGLAERLLGELGQAFAFRAGSAEPFFHPGACGELLVEGERAAWVGEIHPETADRFGLEVPVALAVIDLEALLRHPARPVRYREVSRHPHVRRDLAFVVARDVAAGDLVEAIRRAGGPNLASVDLFDRYEGPGVADGRVSLAFRLVFQRTDRTLTDAEVARAVEQVVARAAERFGAELR